MLVGESNNGTLVCQQNSVNRRLLRLLMRAFKASQFVIHLVFLSHLCLVHTGQNHYYKLSIL